MKFLLYWSFTINLVLCHPPFPESYFAGQRYRDPIVILAKNVFLNPREETGHFGFGKPPPWMIPTKPVIWRFPKPAFSTFFDNVRPDLVDYSKPVFPGDSYSSPFRPPLFPGKHPELNLGRPVTAHLGPKPTNALLQYPQSLNKLISYNHNEQFGNSLQPVETLEPVPEKSHKPFVLPATLTDYTALEWARLLKDLSAPHSTITDQKGHIFQEQVHMRPTYQYTPSSNLHSNRPSQLLNTEKSPEKGLTVQENLTQNTALHPPKLPVEVTGHRPEYYGHVSHHPLSYIQQLSQLQASYFPEASGPQSVQNFSVKPEITSLEKPEKPPVPLKTLLKEYNEAKAELSLSNLAHSQSSTEVTKPFQTLPVYSPSDGARLSQHSIPSSFHQTFSSSDHKSEPEYITKMKTSYFFSKPFTEHGLPDKSNASDTMSTRLGTKFRKPTKEGPSHMINIGQPLPTGAPELTEGAGEGPLPHILPSRR